MEWFQTFLELPNGIPSHDTFNRVFARLDPQEFRNGFMGWIRAASEVIGGQVISLDGKVLRRSHERWIGKAAIDMVSAWASANRLVLGQVKVDDNPTKSPPSLNCYKRWKLPDVLLPWMPSAARSRLPR